MNSLRYRRCQERKDECMGSKAFIGVGAGFAGDRTDAAGLVKALSACDGLRFLMFETLAERTLALSQLEHRRDPKSGFSPALDRFLAPVLARCLDHKIRIVGNFGAANPRAAAKRILALSQELGVSVPRVAVVEGDDLTDVLSPREFAAREIDGKILHDVTDIIAANLYLGAVPIAQALDRNADIVVTGRVADSALALGPLMHSFAWRADAWDQLAAGTLAGHLLECGAQVTGGYFADPGLKDVPRMADIGYPIAEISASGEIILTKPVGTGGRVDRLTVTEQLLYEIHDPAAYLAPDVVLDLTDVTLEEVGADRVRVVGARGKPAPKTLKATVCVDGGILGEAEIPMWGQTPQPALASLPKQYTSACARVRRNLRFASMPSARSASLEIPTAHCNVRGARRLPFRLRFAAQSLNAAEVELLLDEVEALYCAGPAGGAGVRRRTTPRLASASCLIERKYAEPRVTILGGSA